MYTKTGFFDVPALYEKILHDALKKGNADIGYLYLPPYLTDLKKCKRYVSLIPFISSSTEMYLKSIGINQIEEIGKSEIFVKIWGNIINTKTFDENVYLIFHSAPAIDENYKNKIDAFKSKLQMHISKKLPSCFISFKEGWLGPSLTDCSKFVKSFALTGFLFENAELIYEAKGLDIEILKLGYDEIRFLLYNYI